MTTYYVRIAVVLHSEQKNPYELGTVARCISNAIPSREDLKAFLPAGVDCVSVDVRGVDAEFPKPMSVPDAKA